LLFVSFSVFSSQFKTNNKHQGDNCYASIDGGLGKLYYHKQMLSFQEAQNHCRRVDHSQLAIMKDNATLFDVVASVERYRAHSTTNTCFEHYFWVGLSKDGYKYKWLDGNELDESMKIEFTEDPGKTCVSMLLSGGTPPRWIAQDCLTQLAYLCYTPYTPVTTTLPPSPTQRTESTPTPPSPQSVSPVIIGAISAGIFALLLALILAVCLYTRRKKSKREQNLAQNPEVNMGVNHNPVYEESAQEQINTIYNMDMESPLQPDYALITLQPQASGSNDVTAPNDDVTAPNDDVTPGPNIDAGPSQKNVASSPPNAIYAAVNKNKQANDVYSVVNKKK
uniref:C-type lectin domain-containing protein n=1 Tax=Ciona intestinalis TaxID=7719 RepID=H2Y3Q7_CIOIN